MNAYKLADEAEKAFMTNTSHYYAMPMINMLRQQADRIAELEKENKALHELVKQRIARNVELQNLLATPQTKPTTTLMESKAKIFWDEVNKTPQTKPRLSDEEISELAGKTDVFDHKWVWKFARAIEERILGT